MPMRFYRLTVVGCVLSWFLIGFHLPAVHQVTHHGEPLAGSVVAALALLGAAAVAGLWRLLRTDGARRQ